MIARRRSSSKCQERCANKRIQKSGERENRTIMCRDSLAATFGDRVCERRFTYPWALLCDERPLFEAPLLMMQPAKLSRPPVLDAENSPVATNKTKDTLMRDRASLIMHVLKGIRKLGSRLFIILSSNKFWSALYHATSHAFMLNIGSNQTYIPPHELPDFSEAYCSH